jgi:hypothetical protein
MITPETIQRFRRQMTTMTSVARFLTTLGASAPPVFTLVKVAELTAEERERWTFSVGRCAAFVSSIHPTKPLYIDEPSPIAVDPNCPPLDFSDHLQERLGRLHPFFDFIHAPFTRPLGTQFSLVFITYAWDAYDTFIESVLSQFCNGIAGKDTDDRLSKANLLPSDREIATECLRISPDFSVEAEDIPAVILAAKLLRNSFSHHGGDPIPRLKRLVDEKHFHEQLIRFLPDGEFEVVLPMSRLISDVIIAKVELIQSKTEAQV